MYPTEWTLRRLLAEADLPTVSPEAFPDVPIHSLADDSRRASTGCCFAAISGTQQDGHDFVDAAVRKGAAAVITEQPIAVPDTVAMVRVENARAAVARLAAAFYGVNRCHRGQRLRLVGVTGTNGKSTTCQILHSILRAAGHRTAVVGTLGYDLVGKRLPAPLTTPPPIDLCAHLSQAMESGASYAVMEVSSHALDQRRCDGLSFDAAVFTNLSGDHFDYHGTREAYLEAKKQLFDRLDSGAAAIVNDDDSATDELVADCQAPVVRYGISNPRIGASVEVRSTSLSGSRLDLRLGERNIVVNGKLIGEHNALNILAAAATAARLGIRVDDIRDGIEQITVIPGRLQRVEPEGCPIAVLVDYAHSDDSLDHALATLKPLTIGRIICVFGCGGDRDRTKRPRMGAVAGRWAAAAVVTSDNPRTEDPMRIINAIMPGFDQYPDCQTHVESNRGKAIRYAIEMAEPGDTVLIAGKGHEDYQIIGKETTHFDDSEQAREALRQVNLVGHQ